MILRSRRLPIALAAALLLGPAAGPARAGEPSPARPPPPPRAPAAARAGPGAPPPASRPAWRRPLELRQQRRGAPGPRPVGAIAPSPIPPSLITRQTPEAHEEIEGLPRLLRR